jgi:endoglucanase
MLKKTTSVLFGVLVAYVLAAQPAPVRSKTFIQVDQFGYRIAAKKVAVINDPVVGYNASDEFTPSTGANQYQVRRVTDNAPVFSGTVVAWNGGAVDATSGDRAWWFDFSSLTTPGEYYIFDVGKNQRSYKFKIGDNIYDDVLKAAVRMFYYNRCNAEKPAQYVGANYADGASFVGPGQDKNARSIFDKNNANTERDFSGGWWDAGDFNKYVTLARVPINLMLNAYKRNPDIFKDNYNIPESGNGVPDLIDEVKWELDWLKKTQSPSGGSIIKVGNAVGDYTGTTFPSADTRKRYYYPGECSGATISNACVFAHAAAVLKNFAILNDYSFDLRIRAIEGWRNFASKTQLDLNCDDQSQAAFDRGEVIQAGDADGNTDSENAQRDIQFMTAIYLYLLTGEQQYKSFVDSKYNQTVLWRGPDANGQYEVIYADYLDALFAYGKAANATPTVAADIKAKLAERGQTQDYLRFTEAINKDAYRAYVPDYTYTFGGNQGRAQLGALSGNLAFFNVDPSNNQEYLTKSEEILHYFHGVNPNSKVYLSNMYSLGASNSVNEFYHSWYTEGSPWDNINSSKGGPPPGYVVGGPNKQYRVFSFVGNPPCQPNEGAPCNQPAQKSYLDFNDANGFNESFQITEPAIYVQASYIQLLAAFMKATEPPPSGGGIGLTANYYNNTNLSGNPVYTTNEAVDVNWLGGGPGNGVNTDNFSVRWEGEILAPVTGRYSFNTVSDDGVRLWIKDTNIVDNWTDHAETRDFGKTSLYMEANKKYTVTMEFYEKTGKGPIYLSLILCPKYISSRLPTKPM